MIEDDEKEERLTSSASQVPTYLPPSLLPFLATLALSPLRRGMPEACHLTLPPSLLTPFPPVLPFPPLQASRFSLFSKVVGAAGDIVRGGDLEAGKNA